jgi:hypothetical protein
MSDGLYATVPLKPGDRVLHLRRNKFGTYLGPDGPPGNSSVWVDFDSGGRTRVVRDQLRPLAAHAIVPPGVHRMWCYDCQRVVARTNNGDTGHLGNCFGRNVVDYPATANRGGSPLLTDEDVAWVKAMLEAGSVA